MPGEEPFKHTLGVINLLNMTNYATWKEDCIQVLQGIMAWDIVMEVEAEPHEPEDHENFAKEAVLQRKAYKDYLQRKSQATTIIYDSCSSAVKVYIKGMRDPVKMWKELEDTTNGAIFFGLMYDTLSKIHRLTPNRWTVSRHVLLATTQNQYSTYRIRGGFFRYDVQKSHLHNALNHLWCHNRNPSGPC